MAGTQKCVAWVEEYLKDCVWGLADYISLSLGLLSMVTWAVAEVPQIVTNFQNRSTESVSLGFIITWVVGHIFNVVGCLMEPTTLPTQFYTAILFTIAALVLLSQAIYYDHIRKRRSTSTDHQYPYWSQMEYIESLAESNSSRNSSGQTLVKANEDYNKYCPQFVSSLPVPVASPVGGGLVKYLSNSQISSLPISFPSWSSGPHGRGSSQIFPAASAILSIGGLSFSGANALPNNKKLAVGERKTISLMYGNEKANSKVGYWLGWLMTALYMGGRLPQIRLNLLRGSVQGLNPLMFILAILGNATYLGSIIVRTPNWEKLWPNMPWLVDGAACILLDLFILGQYMVYEQRRRRRRTEEVALMSHGDNGDYEAF